MFLAFAVPSGSELIPALTQITADFAHGALVLFDVPAFREGNFLTLPGGSFEVAQVCSGYNYLNAGLALTGLLAFQVIRSIGRGMLLMGIGALVFVLMNGVRAFLTMFIASATNMKYLAGTDHIVFGWVLFFLAMLGVYWLACRLAPQSDF